MALTAILGLLVAQVTAGTSTGAATPRPPDPLPATSTTTTATTADTFVKGEFITAGALRVPPRHSFAGVRIGALLQEETVYLALAPKVDLVFLQGKLRLGFEVPINLEIFSIRTAADAGKIGEGFDNFGRFRKRDYDEARDFTKFLAYAVYGRKEDPLFIAAGQQHATTLGHGQQMRRYTANIDVDQTKVGFEVDAYGPYGGGELTVADITRGNLFGMLGFVKPFAFFLPEEEALARTVSVGFSWVTDQKAPWALQRKPAVGASPIGPVATDEFNAPLSDIRAVNIYGFDGEVKVVKTEFIDLKTYADLSWLASAGTAGNGLTLGALGRFNFKSGDTIHLLRARLELRTYDSTFQPSYFDAIYELQKVLYIPVGGLANPNVSTKLQYITQRGGSRRVGAYLEATYSLPGWFVFAIAFETDNEGQDRHLMLHTEIPLHYLDVFATYHARNMDSIFSFKENDLIFAGARLRILPFMFLNGRVQKAFEWDPTRFDGLGAYARSLNYQVDLEIGAEFGD